MRLKTTLLIVLVIGLLGGIAPGMALAQTDTDAPEATEGANDGLTEMIMARGASLFGVDPLQVGTRTIGVDATWFVGEAVVLRDETTWEGALFIAQRTGDTWNVLFEGDSGFEGARAALPVALADALNAEQASMVAQADVSAQATRTGAFAVRATEAAFVSTTSNFGNRHHLGLGNGGFGLLSMRSFIKFGNLNGSGRVPSGATPTRARLSLWQYSSPSCSLSQFIMQRATGGWSEGGINWGNQPGRAGNYGQQGWPCYSGPPVQRTWDFNSAIVTQMAAGNGMVLVNNPESGFGPLFCSDEPTNGQFCNSANFVPLLTVDWRLEGPGAPSISSPSQNQVLTALPMSVRVNGGSTNRGFSRYEIQISTTGNFSNVIYSSVVSSSGSSHSFNNINDPDLQTGTYYIRARVDDQGRDGIGALRSNWSSTRTFSLNLSADLSVVGTDNPDPVQTGDPITYEFTVANAGPGRVTAAELTVTLDENLTNVTASSDAGACSEPDAVTRVCAIGAINSGSSEIVTVSGTVAEVAITDLQVSAVASSELTDPNTANNDTTVDTTVTPVADMISSIDCPTAGNGVDAGSTVSCTVTATNQGTAAAAAAVLGIESTAGLQPVVSNANGNNCAPGGNGLECALGTLGIGQSTTVTLDVNVNAGASGEVGLTSTTTTTTTESTIDNNDNTLLFNVNAQADVGIAINAPANVIEEGNFQATLTATNNGPGPASDVTATLTVPAGVTYTGSNGSCTLDNAALTCDLGNLAPAGESLVIVDFSVNPGVSDDLVLDVTVAGSDYADNNTANDTASATVEVVTVVVRVAGTTSQTSNAIVPVEIDCVIDACASFQVSLSFNPAEVQVNDVTFGDFLTGSTFNIDGTIDNTNGTISDYASSVLGSASDTGVGTLLNLDVTLQQGVEAATISVTDVIVTDDPGNAVAVKTFDGTVTLTISEEPSVDVNGDGVVSQSDAIYVINRISQTDARADIDGDGTVTEADAQLVLDALGTTIDPPPVE